MDDRETRKLNMFVRVRDFGIEHAADFGPDSLGKQLFTKIGNIVDELETHAATQTSSTGATKQATTTRGQARQALRDDLEAINLTARAMADEVSGLNDKFRVPRDNNDQTLLTAARAFLADATPYAAQFIAHELPSDFLDDLDADIEALEGAIGGQSTGRGHRAAAGAAIDDTIEVGLLTVKKLHAVVKNKYINNAAVLAQWTSASHTERDPRRQNAPPATAAPHQPTPAGEGSAPPA